MEEQDEEGAPTPPLEQRIGGAERRGLLDLVRKQDDTPVAAVNVGFGIFDFCTHSLRLISKIRFPQPI